MEILHLYVSVPITGFRVAQAREYWETYPCPPPSTVYGMLLSLVGEENRLVHQGAEIAVALVSKPERSVALRTLWRIKNLGKIPGHSDRRYGPGQNPEDFGVKDTRGGNRRPDFQELLSDVRLSVWVRCGTEEKAPMPLHARLDSAFKAPGSVSRFGALSLGESTHLVDEIRPWRHEDPKTGQLLLLDNRGDLSLPIWPDHVGSRGTRWGQFKLKETAIAAQPPELAWTAIRPPG